MDDKFQSQRRPLPLGIPHAWLADLESHEIEIVFAILAARSAAECNACLWRAVRPYGVDKFACGEIDLEMRSRAVFFSMQWTESWRRFYLKNIFHRDPLIEHLRVEDEPFTWGEWRAAKRLSRDGSDVMRVVAAHGWTDGFCLPVHRSGMHVALVSLVCRQTLDPAAKRVLTIFCAVFLERIRMVIEPSEFPTPPLGLSPRELESLGLVARGLSDRAIAEVLGVSQATAHEHVQNAMRRIGARSRSEAVGVAVAFGAVRA